MHLHSVHSIGIKLWRKISYNIPLKYKCIFRVKDNRRNMREWSLRKKFTDMVSCVPGLNDELQFSTFRRLGYGGYLRKWESIFSFLFFSFFYKTLWMCGRNTDYMEWLWERGSKVKVHWKTFCIRLWSF